MEMMFLWFFNCPFIQQHEKRQNISTFAPLNKGTIKDTKTSSPIWNSVGFFIISSNVGNFETFLKLIDS